MTFPKADILLKLHTQDEEYRNDVERCFNVKRFVSVFLESLMQFEIWPPIKFWLYFYFSSHKSWKNLTRLRRQTNVKLVLALSVKYFFGEEPPNSSLPGKS